MFIPRLKQPTSLDLVVAANTPILIIVWNLTDVNDYNDFNGNLLNFYQL